MIDLREAILARLLIVADIAAKTVDENFASRRNPTPPLSDTAKWVLVLDGDENSAAEASGRTPMETSVVMVMTPEVQFRVIAKSETAGTELNALRAALIPAVLGDTELLRLCNTKTKMRYRGATTVVERATKVDGAIGLGFAFHYMLKPTDLAA